VESRSLTVSSRLYHHGLYQDLVLEHTARAAGFQRKRL
jgi:hypothetical protein